MSDRDFTSGDPLGGGESRPPLAPPAPSGYTGQRPPGADSSERLDAFGSPAPVAGLGPQLELAGWWRRVGAAVIDAIIVGVIALIFLIPLGIGAFNADTEGGLAATVVALLLTGLVLVVVGLIYAPFLMAKTNGQTLGRMATGIRVVRTNGEPMDFGTAALREVVFKALLINTIASSFTFGLATLLDYLWPLWDEENRALHDFPVNTRTVRS